jgi:ABC-type transport system involved in cytochrome bd biosynthesis fused ATPase/permease subunit
MNRIISWLQSIRLCQLVTVFLVGLTFVISTAFDRYGNELQAQAEPVTPEANKYQVDRTSSQIRLDAGNVKEKAQEQAKDLAEDTKQATKNAKENTQDAGKNLVQNIREKLNLDEPIDAPKESLKNAAEKVGTYRE